MSHHHHHHRRPHPYPYDPRYYHHHPHPHYPHHPPPSSYYPPHDYGHFYPGPPPVSQDFHKGGEQPERKRKAQPTRLAIETFDVVRSVSEDIKNPEDKSPSSEKSGASKGKKKASPHTPAEVIVKESFFRPIISPMNMESAEDTMQQMEDSSPGSNPSTDANNNARSASYTPIDATTSAGATTPSFLGNSVVGDLMQVYESLTQSSTPHQQQTTGDTEPYHPHDTAHSSSSQHHFQPPAPAHYPGAPPPAGSYYHQPAPAPYPYYSSDGGPPEGSSNNYAMHPPPPPHGSYHPSMEHAPYPPAPAAAQDPSTSASAETGGTSSRRRGSKRRASADTSGSGTSSGSSSKHKGRKKTKSTDDRWSKRFTWPEHLHRDFVASVFDVGLKHATPSTIMEQWKSAAGGDDLPNDITTERVKSHLQKYRIHRAKSKQEFMNSYDTAVGTYQTQGLTAGEPAAYSAAAVMAQGGASTTGAASVHSTSSSHHHQVPAPQDALSTVTEASTSGHESLALPRLTDQEKSSPVGLAMGHLMGIFFSLKHQINVQRAEESRRQQQQQTPTSSNKPGGQAQDHQLESPFNALVPVTSRPLATAAAAAAAASINAVLDPPLDLNALAGAADVAHPPIAAGAAMKTTSTDAAAVLTAPSMRTNLEENNLMKREMKNQMAFQNKMRALKQQELNKCRTTSGSPKDNQNQGEDGAAATDNTNDHPVQGKSESDSKEDSLQGSLNRDRVGSEDWLSNMNMDVNDEDLFEFLMN